MKWLVQMFTWWNGQSLTTRLHTWRTGELVGLDEFGNSYYRTKGGEIHPALGFERRWVIYNGVAEGSRTPPGWYGWLHHMTDIAPPDEDYQAKPWEKSYIPNRTGTPEAWRPQGSTLATGQRPSATGDYQAWTPEG